MKALSGTTILAADPDGWEQVTALPTSVTWTPPGPAVPFGDPGEHWTIDNDFLLLLGPGSGGVKRLRVEWLAAGGVVTDVLHIKIPCFASGAPIDPETDWLKYTAIVKGGTHVFAYLEPDDCDPGDFDYERAGCTIQEKSRSCVPGTKPNTYSVTLEGSAVQGASGYEWTIQGVNHGAVVIQTTGNSLTTPLESDSYTVTMTAKGLDADGNETVLSSCTASIYVAEVRPDFSWTQQSCSTTVELDAAPTSNSHLITEWSWGPASLGISKGKKVTFKPPSGPGTYTITLSAKDEWGCRWETTKTIQVVDCSASWEWSYSWCVQTIDPKRRADVTVTFTNTSIGCDPEWTWDFDDPSSATNTSKVKNPTHTYVAAEHGDVHNVKLTMVDKTGCTKTVTIPLTLAQRTPPVGSVKVCPSGKVVCTTSEEGPAWSHSGGFPPPIPAPWPWTKDDGTREIYLFPNGTHSMTLTSKNSNSNVCKAVFPFTVHQECCSKRTVAKATSPATTLAVGGQNMELRVKGRLAQFQAPFVHRVKAKTILQRRNSKGRWARYKHSGIAIAASFTGTVYRPETALFADRYFAGCNCFVPTSTSAPANPLARKKVRVSHEIGGRFRSKKDSIVSSHVIIVNGVTYPQVTLSLGKEGDCAQRLWWTEDFI